MNIDKSDRLVLAVGIGLLLMGVVKALPNLKLPSLPVIGPSVPVDEPGPLAKLVEDKDLLPLYAKFYEDLAEVIDSDEDKLLTNTEQIRNMQSTAVRLVKQSSQLPTYSKLRDEINERMENEFGLEARPLDRELRSDLVEFFRQVSEDF